MFEKFKDFYLDVLCFSCYRDIVGSKAPREKWSRFIGDHIWILSFYFNMYCIMISVAFISMAEIHGLPWREWSVSIFLFSEKDISMMMGIFYLIISLIVHYWFFKFYIGYDEILSVIKFRAESNKAKFRYYCSMMGIILLGILSAAYAIFKALKIV